MTTNVPNLFWTTSTMEQLRLHPRCVALPSAPDLSSVDAGCSRFIRQDSSTWRAMHSGALTTGSMKEALGMCESLAAKQLKNKYSEHAALLGIHADLQVSHPVKPAQEHNLQRILQQVAEFNQSKTLKPHKPHKAQQARAESSELEAARAAASARVAARGLQSVRMSWGTVQEPASLHELLDIFPEAVLLEVGLHFVDREALPSSWGLLPNDLPPLGASPDALIVHMCEVPYSSLEQLQVARSAKEHVPGPAKWGAPHDLLKLALDSVKVNTHQDTEPCGQHAATDTSKAQVLFAALLGIKSANYTIPYSNREAASAPSLRIHATNAPSPAASAQPSPTACEISTPGTIIAAPSDSAATAGTAAPSLSAALSLSPGDTSSARPPNTTEQPATQPAGSPARWSTKARQQLSRLGINLDDSDTQSQAQQSVIGGEYATAESSGRSAVISTERASVATGCPSPGSADDGVADSMDVQTLADGSSTIESGRISSTNGCSSSRRSSSMQSEIVSIQNDTGNVCTVAFERNSATSSSCSITISMQGDAGSVQNGSNKAEPQHQCDDSNGGDRCRLAPRAAAPDGVTTQQEDGTQDVAMLVLLWALDLLGLDARTQQQQQQQGQQQGQQQEQGQGQKQKQGASACSMEGACGISCASMMALCLLQPVALLVQAAGPAGAVSTGTDTDGADVGPAFPFLQSSNTASEQPEQSSRSQGSRGRAGKKAGKQEQGAGQQQQQQAQQVGGSSSSPTDRLGTVSVAIREVIEVKNHCPFDVEVKRRGPRGGKVVWQWLVRDRGPCGSMLPLWVPQLQLHMLACGCGSGLLVSRSCTKGVNIFRLYRDDAYIMSMLLFVSRFYVQYVKRNVKPPKDMFYKENAYRAFLKRTVSLARNAEIVVHQCRVPHMDGTSVEPFLRVSQ